MSSPASFRSLPVLAALLPAVAGFVAAADTRVTVTEAVDVHRVQWPVLVEPTEKTEAAAARCRALAPADVVVREDGVVRPVVGIEGVGDASNGSSPYTLHAILVDTSPSMEPFLRQTREAARGYIEGLAVGESVAVGSIDSSLILRPATRDREEALARLDDFDVGFKTALWESMILLLRHLEHLPGQKVVILLGDGQDSVPARGSSLPDALAAATMTRDVTVFPIGLPLTHLRRDAERKGHAALGTIARETGGEVLTLRSSAGLAGAFGEIRRRIDERVFVTYVPQPFGEGPEDGAERRPHRWRKVDVALREGLPCRVESLRPDERLAGERPAGPEAQIAEATRRLVSAGTLALRQSCRFNGTPEPAGPAARVAYSDAWPEDGGQAVLGFAASSLMLAGTASDRLKVSGSVFKEKAWFGDGDLRADSRARTEFGERPVGALLPPLDDLHAAPPGAGQVLWWLIESGCIRPPRIDLSDSDRPPVRSPLLVEGRTLFELRPALARLLLEERDDYVGHAADQLAERVRQDLGRLAGEASADQLEAAVRARTAAPTSADTGWLLANWHGDVDAAAAFGQLEAMAASRLLGDPEAWDRVDPAAVVSAWPRLATMFPPAVDVRLLAPLVAVLDAPRETLGFYRFVLPRPRWNASDRPPLVPPVPLGLVAVEALAARPELQRALERRVRVVDVRYEPDRRAPDGLRQPVGVDLVLVPARNRLGTTVRLTAWFDALAGTAEVTAEQLACAEPTTKAGSRTAARALSRLLERELAEQDLLCSRR